MEQLVDFANDQPQNNVDRVIWWLEYLLRHNGTINLKGTNSRTPFYGYNHIEIIAALLMLLSAITLTVVKMYLFLSNHTKYVKKIRSK